MKIAIISPFSFGYIDSLADKLAEKEGVDVVFINKEYIDFEYSNFAERAKNFFLKTFSDRNLKQEFIEEKIKEKMESPSRRDAILVVRPDKFSRNHLEYLKSQTDHFKTYLFDAVSSIPQQLENIELFDEVYSYEKEDVEKYKFNFVTNFIPFDTKIEKKGRGLFNISSYDERFPAILKVAASLKNHGYPYKIVVRKEKSITSDLVEFSSEYWPLEKAGKHIEASEILLDIQKKDQHGLSFRVFEALGLGKKLITTNSTVKEYDFYRSENILIIDKKNPVIPSEFLEQASVEISEEIKAGYRREAWLKTVFNS